MDGTTRRGRDGSWDAGMAVVAGMVAALGVVASWPLTGVAVAVAAVPVLGFLLAGRMPGRGAAVGCVAMALGVTLIRPGMDVSPGISLAMLAGIGLAAWFGGAQADRMAESRGLVVAPTGGRWASIIVECDGPAGGSMRVARPRLSPHPAPERRSTARLASERRRGRRPARSSLV